MDPGLLQPCSGPPRSHVKVFKIATDVTARKMRDADTRGQLDAINKVQAVIEFDLTGKILTANENFLSTLGYRLDEIVGRHHAIFVDGAERNTPAYTAFWAALGRGEYQRRDIGASPSPVPRSGSRRVTTRSSIRTADRTRSLSLLPTSLRRLRNSSTGSPSVRRLTRTSKALRKASRPLPTRRRKQRRLRPRHRLMSKRLRLEPKSFQHPLGKFGARSFKRAKFPDVRSTSPTPPTRLWAACLRQRRALARWSS